MPFEPGQSGNPSGTKREKKFAAALDRAIAQDDGKKLRAAAEKLLEAAANGEGWAVQQLADRLDGKPRQEIESDVYTHDGEVSEKPLSSEAWEQKHGNSLGATSGSATRAH